MESVIAMTLLAILAMLFVSLCASPFVSRAAIWFGATNEPLTFQQSFRAAFVTAQLLCLAFLLGQLLIEWPASVLGLDLGGDAPKLQFDKDWRLVGRHYFSNRVVTARRVLKGVAVAACLVAGFLAATTFETTRLSPQGVMLMASMAALAPVAWLFAIAGRLSPALRKFMTTRTEFVPVGS